MMPTLDFGIIEYTNCCAPSPKTITPKWITRNCAFGAVVGDDKRAKIKPSLTV